MQGDDQYIPTTLIVYKLLQESYCPVATFNVVSAPLRGPRNGSSCYGNTKLGLTRDHNSRAHNTMGCRRKCNGTLRGSATIREIFIIYSEDTCVSLVWKQPCQLTVPWPVVQPNQLPRLPVGVIPSHHTSVATLVYPQERLTSNWQKPREPTDPAPPK